MGLARGQHHTRDLEKSSNPNQYKACHCKPRLAEEVLHRGQLELFCSGATRPVRPPILKSLVFVHPYTPSAEPRTN
jgi:hypothetical protein